MNQKIQMVDLVGQYNQIKSEILDAIQRVLEQANFIKGQQVTDFERHLGGFVNSAFTVSCGNGTDALQIALMALGLERGSTVIIPSFTYIATVEVAALLGLKVKLVDVDEDFFTIQSQELEELLLKEEVKAVMPVHLFGQSADMQTILDLQKKHSFYIVEDNAQALGAICKLNEDQESFTGTMGDIGCTSFFPSKNLGAYGDGGAMFAQNQDLANKLRTIANHGQKVKYKHDELGVNSRLDTIQAAILDVKLSYLKNYNEKRQWVARLYDEAISDWVKIPAKANYSTHVYHQYTVKVERKHRDPLKEHLAKLGIPTMVYYPLPVHYQPAYHYLGYKKGDFPVSERLSEEVLSLPIHTELDEPQIEYIVKGVKSYFV